MILVSRAVEPVAASTVGATLGAAVNYTLNHRFTFRSQRTHRAALPRYVLVTVIGIALNGLLLGATLALASHYLAAQAAATAAVLLWNFMLNRAWTFGGSRYAQ